MDKFPLPGKETFVVFLCRGVYKQLWNINLSLQLVDLCKGFAKNEHNSVAEESNNSDPSNVLRIFTSCILFTDATSVRACEVLRIRNTLAHLPSLQVSNAMLNKYLYTVGLLERDIIR